MSSNDLDAWLCSHVRRIMPRSDIVAPRCAGKAAIAFWKKGIEYKRSVCLPTERRVASDAADVLRILEPTPCRRRCRSLRRAHEKFYIADPLDAILPTPRKLVMRSSQSGTNRSPRQVRHPQIDLHLQTLEVRKIDRPAPWSEDAVIEHDV